MNVDNVVSDAILVVLFLLISASLRGIDCDCDSPVGEEA